MCQLQCAALQIELLLLILAHAVELFAVVGLKAHGDAAAARAGVRRVHARADFQRGAQGPVGWRIAVALIFAQDGLPIAQEGHHAKAIDVAADMTVYDARALLVNADLYGHRRSRQQGVILAVCKRGGTGGANAQRVQTPRLNHHLLVVKAVEDAVFHLREHGINPFVDVCRFVSP